MPQITVSLSKAEKNLYSSEAMSSPRKRVHKVLHERGAYKNKVVNFMCTESYMQPHMHPGQEKIEHIYLLEGKLVVFFFDDDGEIKNRILLKKDGEHMIVVPAFTWHTYVILESVTITYETMDGIYSPETWKTMASWAPAEDRETSKAYLEKLRTASSAVNI